MTKIAAIRMLESFNNKFLRRVLGTTKAQQCIGHITSAEIRRRFGMQETLDDVIFSQTIELARSCCPYGQLPLAKEAAILAGYHKRDQLMEPGCGG